MIILGAVSAMTLAACGGGQPGATSHPRWAKALGAGVTVSPPVVQASTGTPGATVDSYVAVLNAGKAEAVCALVEPAAQSVCSKALAGAPASGVKYTNVKLGYVAVEGDEALVGVTGTYCDPTETPACSTNTDPAAIFSSGKPFDTLYSQAVDDSNSNSNNYSLAPCQEVNSKWYIDVPLDDFTPGS